MYHNHVIELSSSNKVDSRVDYILDNPILAGWVEAPEDYLHSSTRNYAGLNSLIDVDFIYVVVTTTLSLQILYKGVVPNYTQFRLTIPVDPAAKSGLFQYLFYI